MAGSVIGDRLNFLLKDTALYGVANAASKAIAFLTLPIVVSALTVEQLGAWNILTLTGTLLSAVAIFGMDSAVVRFFHDDKSQQHHKCIFSHGLYVQSSVLVVLFIPCWFLNTSFLSALNLNETYDRALQLIIFWLPANVFVQYFQNWFKWTFQRFKFLSITLGNAALNLLVLFASLQLDTLSLERILSVNVIAGYLFVLVGLFWCRHLIGASVQRDMLQKLLMFGFPMMLVMLVGNLTAAIDRLLLTHYISGTALGVYSFAQKLSMAMTIAVTAFQTAFGPFAYSIWMNEDAKVTFSRFQSFFLLGCGILGIGLVSFIKPIVLLFGSESYLDSSRYFYLFVLCAIVYGLYSFASLGIFYSKRMLHNLLALLIGLGVAAVTGFILVPFMSEYGALLAILLGNIAMVIAAYLFSHSSYPVHFAMMKDTALLLLLTALLFLASTNFHNHVFVDAALKGFLLVPIYILGYYLMISKEEKRAIQNLLKVRRPPL